MNKTSALLLLAIVLLAAAGLAAWRMRQSANSQSAAATAQSVRNGPMPEIWLSVNGSGDADVAPGWPLIVEVLLLHPRVMQTHEKVVPITIAPREGSGSDAIHVTVRREKGGNQSWPLSPVAVVEPKLRLDALASGRAYWAMSPEETQTLADGDYELVATLEVKDSAEAGGWKGTARSRPLMVHVRRPADPAAAEVVAQKYSLLASYATLRHDPQHALAYVDEALLRAPTDVHVWELEGDVLASANRNAEALFAYSRALKLFYAKNPSPAEPPASILVKEREMVRRALAEQ